ncbi:MAG: hypothetical protein IBJ11_00635 [Phycisphaerales bacterium]|nr:hypothetical protein [Phycisphaerales bacterium]
MINLTLWDLLPAFVRKARPKAPRRRPARPEPKPPGPAQRAYDAMVAELLAQYGLRVRKWRSTMSGIAWEVYYADGRTARLIEAPRPKGPMSAAIFLHEVGHHAIGFHTYKPRCLEEFHAWAWAIAQMELRGLNITERVRKRMHDSLHYAIGKARRRGLRELPAELAPFVNSWRSIATD